MRVYLLTLLLVIVLAPELSAQDVFGARVGVTAATMTGNFETVDESETRWGFVGGFYTGFTLRYGLTVQAEVLYTQKGFSTEAMRVEPDGTLIDLVGATFDLTTLDIPVLVKYEAELGRDLLFGGYAGPYVGFELSERLRIEAEEGMFEDRSDSFVPVDFGFVLGVDATVIFSTFESTFGVRYARSAVNQLEEDAPFEVNADPTAYHSVFSFLVGIRL